MRRIIVTILSICALTAFAMPKTALAFARANDASAQEIPMQDESSEEISSEEISSEENSSQENTSQEDSSSDTPSQDKPSEELPTTPSNGNTQLLAPTTYEQYLSMSAPLDVAVCDNFIAIADGNILYVYDRIDSVYRKYTHGDGSPQNTITKIQFDSEERLYFLDAATALHVLDPLRLDEPNVTATKTDLVCSGFAVFENQLYYANTSGNKSQISSAPLNNLTFRASTTLVDNLMLTPVFAFYKNELYYTNSGQYLYKISTKSGSKESLVSVFDQEILSLSIVNGKLYTIVADGTFLAYDLTTLSESKEASQVTPIDKKEKDFSALATYKNHAYLIQKKCILQYSLQDSAFTDYEISSASSSKQRLNNAKDVTLADNKLFLADVGNKRVSVYDIEDNKFLKPISANFSAQYIAADANTVMLANQTEAKLYHLSEENYGEQLATSPRLDGNLVGIANVYGKYYLVTDKNRFYTLAQNTETSEWEWATVQKNAQQIPTLFTADAYGNLYVACGANVFIYTESNFTTDHVSTKAVLTNLPANAKKICVDYRKNLYALEGNTLYKYTAPKKSNGSYTAAGNISLDETLIYGAHGDVTSIAVSLDNNTSYILYKGTFLAATEKLQLPHVNNIPVDNADKSLFNKEETPFTVIKTNPNALLVEFDINSLRDADVFPILSYKRSEASITALKIGEVDVYNILAVYNEKTAKYNTYLVYANACAEYKTEVYRKMYDTEEQRVGYISSNAALYKIPYTSTLFATADIARSESVTLLREIKKLDRLYYYVSYENAEGEKVTGYLPQVYITASPGELSNATLTLGGTDTHTDAYARLAYILSGTAIICLLVDYLILRNPKEEYETDEEEAE